MTWHMRAPPAIRFSWPPVTSGTPWRSSNAASVREYDDNEPMTITEFQDSIARVALRRGHDPAAQALRELLAELLVDEQPLHRIGAFIAGRDIR